LIVIIYGAGKASLDRLIARPSEGNAS